jgi:hypothetical protein
MKHIEFSIQCSIIEWARYNAKKYPCLEWLHMVGNGQVVTGKDQLQRAIRCGRLKKMGAVAGVFDLKLDHAAHGFHGLALECKTPQGVMSQAQHKYAAFLKLQGYKAVVVRSVDEGITCLQEYLAGVTHERD